MVKERASFSSGMATQVGGTKQSPRATIPKRAKMENSKAGEARGPSRPIRMRPRPPLRTRSSGLLKMNSLNSRIPTKSLVSTCSPKK